MKISLQKLMALPAATLLLLNFGDAVAKRISPEQAITRINAEARNGVSEMPAVKPEALKLAYTYNAEHSIERPMMYVFTPSSGKGFVLSAADDEFPAIIGYSDSSTFDASHMSPTLKWWLGQYEKEMDWILQHPEAAAPERAELGTSVEPMLTTLWDQSTPYNDLAPTMDGRKTMTGCVATAMAQIMKYHNYPKTGKGWINYSWNKQNLSFNFGITTFDWENMLDKYTTGENRNYSQDEATAVATLMQACGYAVKMNYGTSASGTSSYTPAPAFVEYFNYSSDIRNISRDFYTIMDWEKAIYASIAAKMPVLLTGQSGTGGHAFVCDGYSSNHYFHINWGWGGYQDGYFLLSMLNPSSGGIGSSVGGYNSLQTAIINIKPQAGGTPAEAELVCDGNFTYDGLVEEDNEYAFKALGVDLPGFYNLGSTIFKGEVGLIVENPDKTTVDYPYNYMVDVEPGYGVSYIPAAAGEVPAAGVYKIYPAYRLGDEGSLKKMKVYNGCNPYVVMTVDNQGNVSFANAPDEREIANIEVTDFESTEEFAYRNFPSTFKVTVKNNSADIAYSDPITMKICKGSKTVQEKQIFVSVWPDESFTQTTALTWTAVSGEYDVVFTDINGKTIGSGYKMQIVDGTPSNLQTHIKMTDVTPTSFNPSKKYTLNITFTNDYPAPLSIPLSIVIYDDKQEELFDLNIQSITFPANTTNVLRTEGFETDFGTGNFYMQFYSKGDAISEKFPFRVGEPAESITLTPATVTVEAGKTVELTTEILPADAVIGTLIWESQNTSIAKVSRTGVVTGVAQGQTTITVSVGTDGPKATCEVTVTPGAGIDELFSDEDTISSVVTSDGVTLQGISTKEQLLSLPAGVYIVNVSGRQTKVMIGK